MNELKERKALEMMLQENMMDPARGWHGLHPRNITYCGRHELEAIDVCGGRTLEWEEPDRKGLGKNRKKGLTLGEKKEETKENGRIEKSLEPWKKVVVLMSVYLLLLV